MAKRNPEETLKLLEDQAFQDQLGDVAAMSDRELDDALRMAGVDVAAAHSAGRRIAAEAVKAGRARLAIGEGWVSAPPPAPRRSSGGRWVVLFAASLTAAFIGGIIYEAGRMHHTEDNVPDRSMDSGPADNAATAERLRARALAACQGAQWQECANGLTAARALDPRGDAQPRVQAAWRAARDGLAAQEPRRAPIPDSKSPPSRPSVPDEK